MDEQMKDVKQLFREALQRRIPDDVDGKELSKLKAKLEAALEKNKILKEELQTTNKEKYDNMNEIKGLKKHKSDLEKMLMDEKEKLLKEKTKKRNLKNTFHGFLVELKGIVIDSEKGSESNKRRHPYPEDNPLEQ